MILFSYRLTFLTLLVFVNVKVFAQRIDSMMNLYRDNFPQEKIYVHFDKSYYNPGETIWFKGYIMSGINLSGISKNFYTELINERGIVLQRIVAPILDGSASSGFTIPLNYSGS